MTTQGPDSRGRWSAALLVGAVCLTAGCQTYDFFPVSPLAISQHTVTVLVPTKGLKPNLMFSIDRSGSMNLPFSGTSGPSRLQTVQSTTASFLSANPTIGRMGVAFLPGTNGTPILDPVSGNSDNGSCAATNQIAVTLPQSDDTTTLTNAANAVSQAIQTVTANGGTPTGDSLEFISRNAGFDTNHRDSFLLLMTDGLPNCDPTSGLNYDANATACDCTDTSASNCTTFPVLLCNDYQGVATKISDILSRNIKTIVVGYGDLVGTDAANSLQAMALAGGYNRRCNLDGSECAPTDITCLTSSPTLCAQQFFQVTTQAQLAAALAAISATIQTNPCQVFLPQPPQNPALVSVDVTDNGVTTSYPYTTTNPVWTLSGTTLTFLDPLCSKMKSQTDTITYVVREASVL